MGKALDILIPRPEEEMKGSGFSCLRMCLIAVHIHRLPPPPHTINILPYARGANINTKLNTVCRFMIAKYGMLETH